MAATLHGLSLPEAATRMGQIGQCARLDHFTHEDGPERGSRLLRVITGGGLAFDVYPDRALDIGQLCVRGIPVAWMSPTGITAPGLYDATSDRFLRTFGGGFLATCGLDHFGGPCEDDGQKFGQHGRFGGIPSRLTRTNIDDDGICIEGTVRQARVHGENIELKRRIHAPLGGTQVTVTDTVTNMGAQDQPHMILYHCNFGWPLLSEDSKMEVPSDNVAPHCPEAKDDPWNALAAPQAGYKERVYLHTLKKGRVAVSLANPKVGIKVTMSFNTDVLPGLCQWKMLGESQYVMGLEPTNGLALGGRAQARKDGALKMLKPKQSVTYALTFDIS